MDDLTHGLQQLGRTVSNVSSRMAGPEAIDAARRKWSAPPAAQSARRAWLALPAAAALALGVALLVLIAPGLRASGAISFEVGSPPAHGGVGDWLAADGQALPVLFSEGTTLALSPGARIRVTETSARGAGVLIERGGVDAAVVHAADTRWTMNAGPFVVRVTGTRFHAAWDPSTDIFDLDMKEGSVVVSGPLLPKAPGRAAGDGAQPGGAGTADGRLVVVAGERLRISVRDAHLELSGLGTAAVAPAARDLPVAPATLAAEAVVAVAPAAVGLPTPASSPSPGSAAAALPLERAPAASSAEAPLMGPRALDLPPTWRELSAAGKFKEALALVDEAGFAQEIERASAPDLLSLADLARYASRPALARDALLALRRRFGSRGRSAFLLGKIAADQLGSPGDAARWFETYLGEEPGGGLAEQALGRLIELRKGSPAAAQAVAQRYLRRYPQGAYAALAKSLLDPLAASLLTP